MTLKTNNQQHDHDAKADVLYSPIIAAAAPSSRPPPNNNNNNNNDYYGGVAVVTTTTAIAGAVVTVTIHQGRNLIGKDRNLLGMRSTSDPYVTAIWQPQKKQQQRQQYARAAEQGPSSSPPSFITIGKTKVISQTLNPVWNESLEKTLDMSDAMNLLNNNYNDDDYNKERLTLYIYDHDYCNSHDSMGVVSVPFPSPDNSNTNIDNINISSSSNGPEAPAWYSVETGDPSTPWYCHNAQGELQVSVAVRILPMMEIQRGMVRNLDDCHKRLQVGIRWEPTNTTNANDVMIREASCVAVNEYGQVDWDESLYFGNIENENRSLMYCRPDEDEMTSIAPTGVDNNEVIQVQMDHIPSHIIALYFIVTLSASAAETSSRIFNDHPTTLPTTTPTIPSSLQLDVVAVPRTDEYYDYNCNHNAVGICRYHAPPPPAMVVSGGTTGHNNNNNTAFFLVRLARDRSLWLDDETPWILAPIGDVCLGAHVRNLSNLIPHLHSYTQDLIHQNNRLSLSSPSPQQQQLLHTQDSIITTTTTNQNNNNNNLLSFSSSSSPAPPPHNNNNNNNNNKNPMNVHNHVTLLRKHETMSLSPYYYSLPDDNKFTTTTTTTMAAGKEGINDYAAAAAAITTSISSPTTAASTTTSRPRPPPLVLRLIWDLRQSLLESTLFFLDQDLNLIEMVGPIDATSQDGAVQYLGFEEDGVKDTLEAAQQFELHLDRVSKHIHYIACVMHTDDADHWECVGKVSCQLYFKSSYHHHHHHQNQKQPQQQPQDVARYTMTRIYNEMVPHHKDALLVACLYRGEEQQQQQDSNDDDERKHNNNNHNIHPAWHWQIIAEPTPARLVADALLPLQQFIRNHRPPPLPPETPPVGGDSSFWHHHHHQPQQNKQPQPQGGGRVILPTMPPVVMMTQHG